MVDGWKDVNGFFFFPFFFRGIFDTKFTETNDPLRLKILLTYGSLREGSSSGTGNDGENDLM